MAIGFNRTFGWVRRGFRKLFPCIVGIDDEQNVMYDNSGNVLCFPEE